MAIRFRKSIKLAPGLRMNLSGSGVGWTLGPRGASIGIGQKGTYLNTGIPGSGFYARQALSSGGRSSASPVSNQSGHQSSPVKSISLTVSVEDDGTITFKDDAGNPVSEGLIDAAKKQKGTVIRQLIQDTCNKINRQVDALGELHLYTPNPRASIKIEPQPFSDARPIPPVAKRPGFFERLFKSKLQAVESENLKATAKYNEQLLRWKEEKAAFEEAERERLSLFGRAQSGDPEAMEAFFSQVLLDINWPKETNVSFEVLDSGRSLWLDVDLPEIEDMPNRTAVAPQRGYKMSVKELGPVQLQKLYSKHIHSIGFRIVGEVFGMLPTVQEVVLSGYSQRTNAATGHVQDDYLLSVRVARSDWEKINFERLETVDVIDALSYFELVRNMSKSGQFKAVRPLTVAGASESNPAALK